MGATWKDDLMAFREERRILLENLRILNLRAIKEGKRVSIGLHHEIKDTTAQLVEIEATIKALETEHKEEIALSPELPEPLVPSPYGKIEIIAPEYPLHTSRRNEIIPSRLQSVHPVLWGVLGISLLALVATIVIVAWNMGKLGKSYEHSHKIVIYPGYYHLGDAFINQFHVPEPQRNPFVARFQVSETGKSVRLSLTACNVDPNAEQSPTRIYLNGNFVAFLNNYFDEEDWDSHTVVIPVDPSVLVKGTNEIKIEVQSTTIEYGQPNLDDFEFWDLTLYVD